MIPSENFCGVLQGKIGHVADDINGDVARESNVRRALFAFDVFNRTGAIIEKPSFSP